MNYLIIDDEPLAHRVIEKYGTELSWLKKQEMPMMLLKGSSN